MEKFIEIRWHLVCNVEVLANEIILSGNMFLSDMIKVLKKFA